MILREEVVQQIIDLDRRAYFHKQVLMTRGASPLGIVRKRLCNADGVVQASLATVILVHGFGQNRYTWHTSKRSFSAYLAMRGFDVFNVDLRGHGRSRRFGAAVPTRVDDYIREDMPRIAEEVARISGQNDFYLVGHSMGGLISYGCAGSQLRRQVRGIVSLGAPYRFGRGSTFMTMLRELASFVSPTGLLDYNVPLPVRHFGEHLRKRKFLWETLPLPVRGWSPGSVEKPILDEYLEKSFERTSLSIALDIFRAGQDDAWKSIDGRVDYRTSFEMLDRPILVVAGTLDRLAPVASVRPAYEASRSSDKTYKAFAFGHVDLIMGHEAPTTLWPTVADWLVQRADVQANLRSAEFAG